MQKPNKSKNPSAVKSRKMIIDALLRLMKRKRYNKITITDVAKEAQIVRKTFYTHYYSMDEVLDEYIEMLFTDYINELKSKKIHTLLEYVINYFEFWQSHYDFLVLLHKNDRMVLILKKYEELLPLIHQDMPCALTRDNEVYQYYVSFISAGFWRLLCKWVESGGKEKPEDMLKSMPEFLDQLSENMKK